MLRILKLFALVFLVSCSQVMEPIMSTPRTEFFPVNEGQSFPRSTDITVVEAGQRVDLSGYTRIGKVATRIRSSFCSAEIGDRSCDIFENAPDRARASAIAGAQAAGGDLIVLGRGGSAGRVFSLDTIPNPMFSRTVSGYYGIIGEVYRRN